MLLSSRGVQRVRRRWIWGGGDNKGVQDKSIFTFYTSSGGSWKNNSNTFTKPSIPSKLTFTRHDRCLKSCHVAVTIKFNEHVFSSGPYWIFALIGAIGSNKPEVRPSSIPYFYISTKITTHWSHTTKRIWVEFSFKGKAASCGNLPRTNRIGCNLCHNFPWIWISNKNILKR